MQEHVDADGKCQTNVAEEEAKDDDIIPIISEPEILCITSSDSENEDAQFLNKVKRSYITMPTVEKEIRAPTEDELFLEKVKQKTSIEVALKQSKDRLAEEPSSKAVASEKTESGSDVAKVVEEAPEDGEIVEDDVVEDAPVEEVLSKSEVVDLAESSDEEIGPSAKNCDSLANENKSDVLEDESHEKSAEEKSSIRDSDDDTDDGDSTELVSDIWLMIQRLEFQDFKYKKKKMKNTRLPKKVQSQQNDRTMKTKTSLIWARMKILISRLKTMKIPNRR